MTFIDHWKSKTTLRYYKTCIQNKNNLKKLFRDNTGDLLNNRVRSVE